MRTKITDKEKLSVALELYREQVLKNQDLWMAVRVAASIPDLAIKRSGPSGWRWNYKELEQKSDLSPTVFDCLLDFLKFQLEEGTDLSAPVLFE